jgi:hypothetical protein
MHRRELIDTVGPWCEQQAMAHDREFLQRVLAAKTTTALCPRLTAIKFPAVPWRLYSPETPLPQPAYLAAIRSDPQALQLTLLTEVAALGAQAGWTGASQPRRLPGWLLTLLHKGMDVYGRQRWPLNRLMYRYWRRASGLDEPRDSVPKP